MANVRKGFGEPGHLEIADFQTSFDPSLHPFETFSMSFRTTPEFTALLDAGLALFLALTLLWLVSLWRRDASLIDIFWSLGFLLCAGIYRSHGSEASPRQLLVLALLALWSLRLAGHIAWRHGGEDRRYRKMRDEQGKRFWWWSYFWIFALQGGLILVISAPHLVLQIGPDDPEWRWTDAVGLLLFAVGFFFEAVGDWQLARFKADPGNRGKVLDRGLWSLTRHPNYFGDATLWWGFYFFSLGAPSGIWTLPSVLLMSLLLVKVSGVALLEKTITERRPGYREYLENTPAFFPRWPRARPQRPEAAP